MEFRVTDPETPLSRLFPLESVLEATDSVLDLSCRLVGLALGLQLGIAKHLAGDLLDFAYDSLFRSFDPIFVHDMFSKKVTPPRVGRAHNSFSMDSITMDIDAIRAASK
jgi:hypothetical protein